MIGIEQRAHNFSILHLKKLFPWTKKLIYQVKINLSPKIFFCNHRSSPFLDDFLATAYQNKEFDIKSTQRLQNYEKRAQKSVNKMTGLIILKSCRKTNVN